MSVRRTRFILWIACGAFALATALVLVAGTLSSFNVTASRPGPTVDLRTLGAAQPATADLAGSQPLWNLDLRRPLYDPPPPTPVVAPTAPPPALKIKLAGTIIEPGHNVAMFLLPDGQIEMKRVGEESGGAEVLQIEENSVTVRYYGQSIKLVIPREGQSG